MLCYSCIADEREKNSGPSHIYIYLFYIAAVNVLFFSSSCFCTSVKFIQKRHSRLTANRFICQCSIYYVRVIAVVTKREGEEKTKRSRVVFINLLVLIIFFIIYTQYILFYYI
uniref:Uncharacterized protein n=1 Tax=Schizaphis graminum TaxID=13262 RepID=A0A2S2NWL7_SCHGA